MKATAVAAAKKKRKEGKWNISIVVSYHSTALFALCVTITIAHFGSPKETNKLGAVSTATGTTLHVEIKNASRRKRATPR